MSNLEPNIDYHHLADLWGAVNSEINAQTVGEMLRILREADLSMPRLVTLTFLYHTNTASISAISEHLNLALGTTSHLVDQLVRGGYVERREDELDRRLKQVSLTDKGRGVVGQVRQLRVEEVIRRFSQLPPEVACQLQAALELVVAILRRSSKYAHHHTEQV